MATGLWINLTKHKRKLMKYVFFCIPFPPFPLCLSFAHPLLFTKKYQHLLPSVCPISFRWQKSWRITSTKCWKIKQRRRTSKRKPSSLTSKRRHSRSSPRRSKRSCGARTGSSLRSSLRLLSFFCSLSSFPSSQSLPKIIPRPCERIWEKTSRCTKREESVQSDYHIDTLSHSSFHHFLIFRRQ